MSGQLQLPLSHFYHHSGLFYHHSQGVKGAEMLHSAIILVKFNHYSGYPGQNPEYAPLSLGTGWLLPCHSYVVQSAGLIFLIAECNLTGAPTHGY